MVNNGIDVGCKVFLGSKKLCIEIVTIAEVAVSDLLVDIAENVVIKPVVFVEPKELVSFIVSIQADDQKDEKLSIVVNLVVTVIN